MSRIYPDESRMKIAHWHSQSDHTVEQLDYRNLLAACRGGEGKPFKLQYCDTHQGASDISRNPADLTHPIEKFIRYTDVGRIYSDDETLNNDLDKVLNLNVAYLRNQRQGALNALWETLSKRTLAKSQLEALRQIWNGEVDSGDLKPYCQVIVYWLDKRLRRM
jgi:hypothetical protein